MGRHTGIIPKATMAKILMRSGANRVSAEAATAFADLMESIALDIGSRAVRIAKHAGRKTVKNVDVKLAVE